MYAEDENDFPKDPALPLLKLHFLKGHADGHLDNNFWMHKAIALAEL